MYMLGILYGLVLHHCHCNCDMPFLRCCLDLRNVLLGLLRIRLLEDLFMWGTSESRWIARDVREEQGQDSRTNLEQLLDVLGVRVLRSRAFDTLPGVPEGGRRAM